VTPRARTILCVLLVLVVAGALVVKFVILQPDHVLLAGDSILRQTGPALDNTFGRDVEIDNKAVNNSGLLTPGYVDWVKRLERQVDDGDPAAVVFLFIGNYTDTDYFVDDAGRQVMKNTPEFFEAWGHEADRLMQVLKDAGSEAAVYWVLPPPELSPDNQATTTGLRQVYTELADRWPAITLIDANDALAGPNGEYLSSITNRQGDTVPLRVPDTVHLTDVGARRLARTIHNAIEPHL
jgi:hypothetical protein